MHGLLALTALHQNSVEESHDQGFWRAPALAHYDLALAKSKLELTNVTEENCWSLFVFSSVIVIFALASPLSLGGQRLQGPVTELIQVSKLVRGSSSLVQTQRLRTQSGPLSPLYPEGFLSSTADLRADVTAALDGLKRRLDLCILVGNEAATYERTIEVLRLCLRNTVHDSEDKQVILCWLVMVPEEYMSLVSTQQPMALALLAHYGAMLHGLRSLWWCQDWGYQIVKYIWEEMAPGWESLLHWPRQRTLQGR